MFKKIICCFISILIITLSFSITNAEEEVTVVNNNIIHCENHTMDFEIDNMEFYPFIYDSTNQWEIDYVIGVSDCEDGYLYSKHLSSNTIRKLVNVKIDKFAETYNSIIFIYNNSIYSVDYLGENICKLYNSQFKLNSNILLYDDNKLYFTENNTLVILDLSTNSINKIAINSKIDSIYVNSNGNIEYSTGNVTYSVSNITNSVSKINEEITMINNDNVSITSVTPSTAQLDTNLTSILAIYPNGSYFTYDGGPCSHHGTGSCSYWGGCNCRDYFGTIQCVALAKYASDAYAHKSSWNPNSSDIIEKDIKFTSVSQVRAFFSSIETGAYIRLSYYSESESSSSGFHSIFLIKYDNNYITTYECNLAGNCNVRILKRSVSEFLSDYKNVWGIYRVSHKFSNETALNYNQTYHKIYCSRGCGGYIYEAHYNRNNAGQNTCSVCGYTGTIEYTNKLDLGTYN